MTDLRRSSGQEAVIEGKEGEECGEGAGREGEGGEEDGEGDVRREAEEPRNGEEGTEFVRTQLEKEKKKVKRKVKKRKKKPSVLIGENGRKGGDSEAFGEG